jgi:hypothetical protein
MEFEDAGLTYSSSQTLETALVAPVSSYVHQDMQFFLPRKMCQIMARRDSFSSIGVRTGIQTPIDGANAYRSTHGHQLHHLCRHCRFGCWLVLSGSG